MPVVSFERPIVCPDGFWGLVFCSMPSWGGRSFLGCRVLWGVGVAEIFIELSRALVDL